MITKIIAAVTLGVGATLLVAAPSSAYLPNPDFPYPEEWPELDSVVAQLPPPYRSSIEDACAVASIPCDTPNIVTGLGYTIETAQIRVRLMQGTQVVNALNVEAVIEVRDLDAAYGMLEVMPVCVTMTDGVPGDYEVAGDSATMSWGGKEVGEVINDVYLDMVVTSECDPLLERRDILTIATWSPEEEGLESPEALGWHGAADGVTFGDAPNQVTIRFEVLSYSWVFGSTGTVTMKATIESITGAGAGNFNGSSTVSIRCRDASTLAYTSCVGSGDPRLLYTPGWSALTIGTSKTFTLSPTTTTDCVGPNTVGVVRWCVPGSPGVALPELFTGTSLTAYDVFANIVFAPYSSGAYMGAIAGVCEDLAECMSRCENSGDLIGFFTWVKCLFDPTIDVSEFWDALKLEVVRSTFVGSINTLGTYLFSPMRAIGAVGKHCGMLELVPDGTALGEHGFGINTCTWAQEYPTLTAWTWALLVALIFIGGAMVILRILEGALGLHDPLIGSQAWRDKEGL